VIVQITENILIDGKHTPAGEVIDIDEETASKLILMKRASTDVDEDAAAAAQILVDEQLAADAEAAAKAAADAADAAEQDEEV
jgi:hypothetical protein